MATITTQVMAGARPRRRISDTLKNLWLDITLFVAFIVDSNMHVTGLAIHEWLGILFGVLLVYHLLLHWNWIVAVGGRLLARLPAQERIKALVDILLFVNMIAVVVTGIWISEVAMGQIGVEFAPNMIWRQVHKVSADMVVWLVALHVALNWRWIMNATRRYLWQPLTRPFARKSTTRSGLKETTL